MGNELNRRSFLNAAVSAAGLVAMGPLLSACGGSGAQRAGVNSDAGLKAVLPAYVPNTSIKPDIPSVAGGADVMTDPGFLSYPSNRIATVPGMRLKRSVIRRFVDQRRPWPACGRDLRGPAKAIAVSHRRRIPCSA